MIAALQNTVNTYSYESTDPDLVADGVYGSKTESAVINSQGWYGLRGNGITGPEIWGQFGFCTW